METCPKCGYCPTCGRDNEQAKPVAPSPWQSPWLSGYTCSICGQFVMYGTTHVCWTYPSWSPRFITSSDIKVQS